MPAPYFVVRGGPTTDEGPKGTLVSSSSSSSCWAHGAPPPFHAKYAHLEGPSHGRCAGAGRACRCSCATSFAMAERFAPARHAVRHGGRVVYEWDQTLHEVNVYVTAPPGVRAAQLECQFGVKHLRLALRGNRPYLQARSRFANWAQTGRRCESHNASRSRAAPVRAGRAAVCCPCIRVPLDAGCVAGALVLRALRALRPAPPLAPYLVCARRAAEDGVVHLSMQKLQPARANWALARCACASLLTGVRVAGRHLAVCRAGSWRAGPVCRRSRPQQAAVGALPGRGAPLLPALPRERLRLDAARGSVPRQTPGFDFSCASVSGSLGGAQLRDD